jgi:hypothetical protein
MFLYRAFILSEIKKTCNEMYSSKGLIFYGMHTKFLDNQGLLFVL